MREQKLLELARRCAELQQIEEAQKAYTLALEGELGEEEELEASSYLFFSEGDHRIPFTHFVSLFNRGHFQAEILDLMTQAFYLPNVKKQQKQYEKNVKALSKYPYLFRKDFPEFEELPILFFPFDEEGFVPYDPQTQRFGDYVNVNEPVIDRYFFQDLTKPILARDVFSQYQLEYLCDNVRKSEWVAKENHIYLHYTDWKVFCAWLQLLDFKKNLLKDEKFVFLIEEESSRYPIDFKKEYGIDYSTFPLKPVGLREINRLILHAQLSSHNGGDFFNEILDGHPNLIVLPSLMYDSFLENVEKVREGLRYAKNAKEASKIMADTPPAIAQELYLLRDRTDKDLLMTLYLSQEHVLDDLDPEARIAPAVLVQPHFAAIHSTLDPKEGNVAALNSDAASILRNSEMFKGFRYVKCFTPLRRFTVSYGASIKFMARKGKENEEEQLRQIKAFKKNQSNTLEMSIVGDEVVERVLGRTFMVNPKEKYYRDSRLVRFEDGKLNPKATFTALAEFLDIPYTESMTYCSYQGTLNPESLQGNDLGFSTAAVYRRYDEYANDAERTFLEYFLQDAYRYYGYDFQYYEGNELKEEDIERLIDGFTTLDHHIRHSYRNALFDLDVKVNGESIPPENIDYVRQQIMDQFLERFHQNRRQVAHTLMNTKCFVGYDGQPLQFMKPLELDPALLEQPLYH